MCWPNAIAKLLLPMPVGAEIRARVVVESHEPRRRSGSGRSRRRHSSIVIGGRLSEGSAAPRSSGLELAACKGRAASAIVRSTAAPCSRRMLFASCFITAPGSGIRGCGGQSVQAGSRSRSQRRHHRQRSTPLRHRTGSRSEEHTSELQSPCNLVCRLLLEKKKNYQKHGICSKATRKNQKIHPH